LRLVAAGRRDSKTVASLSAWIEDDDAIGRFDGPSGPRR
jgi:hypothetical protein